MVLSGIRYFFTTFFHFFFTTFFSGTGMPTIDLKNLNIFLEIFLEHSYIQLNLKY